jgi:hypothetical protein
MKTATTIKYGGGTMLLFLTSLLIGGLSHGQDRGILGKQIKTAVPEWKDPGIRGKQLPQWELEKFEAEQAEAAAQKARVDWTNQWTIDTPPLGPTCITQILYGITAPVRYPDQTVTLYPSAGSCTWVEDADGYSENSSCIFGADCAHVPSSVKIVANGYTAGQVIGHLVVRTINGSYTTNTIIGPNCVGNTFQFTWTCPSGCTNCNVGVCVTGCVPPPGN